VIPDRLPWPLVFQVLGVIAAAWFVIETWHIWLLVFMALILAAALLPAASYAERWQVPRGLTVLGVYLAVAGMFALVGRLLWPALTEQWQQFIHALPKLIENVKRWIGHLDVFFGQWGFGGWSASIPTPQPSNVEAIVGTVLANTLKATAGAVGAAVGLLAILVIAAYLVIDAREVGAGLLDIVPPRYRGLALELTGPVLERIGGYVRGQILVSACVGAVLALGLSLLGVRYALLLGALAAVLNVVPWVGSFVAAVLAVIAALNESLLLAGATVLLFWGTNVLEGKVLVPHLVGRATGLHPLAVLMVLLAGAHMGGLVGALVSVPFLAAAWEIVRTVWVKPQRG
jgi:predicted PurR-regulated permease PerM